MSQTEVWLYGADLEPRLNSYWLRYTTDIGIDCSRMFEQFEKRRSPQNPAVLGTEIARYEVDII